MEKLIKAAGWIFGAGFVFILILGVMAITKTGMAVVNDGSRGIMKTGTKYEMTPVKPGYHFFIPIYQTIDVKTIRPILVNYSVSEANRTDEELLQFEPPLKGLDSKGIPIQLALSIEVKPNAEKLPEMYREEGDFDNAFYKKVLQENREAVQVTISKFNVDTIMDKREEVEKMLTNLLKESYSKNPYFTLVGINLKDIIVPKQIRDKQLAVQAAKQDALRSAELIKKAENEAKAKEAVARGNANARLIEAKSIASANKLISASLTQNILKNNAIEKWNGITPTIVGSEKSQFIYKLK